MVSVLEIFQRARARKKSVLVVTKLWWAVPHIFISKQHRDMNKITENRLAWLKYIRPGEECITAICIVNFINQQYVNENTKRKCISHMTRQKITCTKNLYGTGKIN